MPPKTATQFLVIIDFLQTEQDETNSQRSTFSPLAAEMGMAEEGNDYLAQIRIPSLIVYCEAN